MIVKTEFEALDAIVMLPVATPAAVGWKDALKLALCPAANVMGAASPLMLNPDPATAVCETVMLDEPVLVRVSDRLSLVPTGTVPKLRLPELDPRAPVKTPVPVSPIFNSELAAFDAIATAPLASPVVVGANETVNVVFCPAFSVSGV